MSNIKWVFDGDPTPIPQCSRCGAEPLQYMGRDECGYYLHQCGRCGKVYAHKTPLRVLREKAKAKW
jgi:uncharacterized Zn finger protein